ncbi:MAG: FAD binding domain-containing protein [Clostridiales bacterium]|nr:FAD binding domain-containing protein [Clostridiales bacterium]
MKELKRYRPKKTEQVCELMKKYEGECKLIAGGTDLIIQMKKSGDKPKALVDITEIEEMRFVKIEEDSAEIGALTTFTDIVENEELKCKYAALVQAAKNVGSPQIRNRGTIGGNIANGATAADIAPILLALNATAFIQVNRESCSCLEANMQASQNTTCVREMEIEDIYANKEADNKRKNMLDSNEMIYSFKFKNIEANEFLGFYKLGSRKALAISKGNLAVLFRVVNNICTEIRVASGSLGKTPLRERELERFLKGKELREEVLLEAEELYSKVIANRLKGRSSVEYKKEAVKGVFRNAFENAFENRDTEQQLCDY